MKTINTKMTFFKQKKKNSTKKMSKKGYTLKLSCFSTVNEMKVNEMV